MPLSGDIGGGYHCDNARNLFRFAEVDLLDERARVFRQEHGAVKHAGNAHVIDVRPVAKRKLASLIARRAGSDSSGLAVVFDGSFASERCCRQLDRVNYLDVAGTPAMMHAQHAIDLVVGWIGTLVDEILCSNDDARRAKAALKSARGNETVGESIALELAEAFKRQHVLPRDILSRHRARDYGPAIDDDRAASALALRAA